MPTLLLRTLTTPSRARSSEDRYRSYDEKYWLSRKLAPSALILYLGLEKDLEDSHHIIVINSWDEHFEKIFRDPGVSQQPLILYP